MISASTRVFALLGDPISHSLSPAMHTAAFHALGLEAAYVALRCDPADLGPLIRALVRAGGGGNVTVPHKALAARCVDEPAERVRSLGACNTFWGRDGRAAGDNTDVDGLLEALDLLGAPEGGWLVAGTGGSARAVVGAARERCAGLAVLSRDPDRRARFEAWAARCGVALVPPESCGTLINATPLGLRADDPFPIPLEAAPAALVALDLVYAPGETPWVRALRARGIAAADGRGVLVGQGAAALERWFPGVRAPREIMRAVVDAALR